MARVLVVAEEGLARVTAWILEGAGYDVRVSCDSEAALREAVADPPDAIVVNGVLPDDQMPSFGERLAEAAPAARLVDVTPKPGEQPDVPADAHLAQPFHADDLVAQVERVLQYEG